MTIAQRALLPLLVLAGSACGSAIPPYTVNVPPRLDDLRPPRSIAFVREDVPLGGLRKAIDGAVGESVKGKKTARILGREIELGWDLDRKPIALETDAKGLVFEIRLVGKIAVHGKGLRCRDDDAAITFRAEARPGLAASGNIGFAHLDWKPRTRAELRCDGLPIPVDKVVNAIVEPLGHALAMGVGKIELPTGPLVKKALDAMRPPHELHIAKGEGACLDLAPDALVLSPISGNGGTMTLKLGVEVAPRVVLGKCPPSGAAAKQPSVLAKNIPLTDHFEVQTAVAVPYAELTHLLTPHLVGKRFGNADHGVVVDKIEAGDAGGRTLVHLVVHGSIDGDIYLWGTPTLVEEKGRFILKMPDLQVATESKSILQSIGLALWSAVGGGLKGVLDEKLRMDVTDKLTEARKAMTTRHELPPGSPRAVLTTTLTRIDAKAATSKPGVMILWPTLVGSAELVL